MYCNVICDPSELHTRPQQLINVGEKSILVAPHTGKKYKLDALVVHNIITRNISETSHAYTYIKPKINKNNGQIDIEAL